MAEAGTRGSGERRTLRTSTAFDIQVGCRSAVRDRSRGRSRAFVVAVVGIGAYETALPKWDVIRASDSLASPRHCESGVLCCVVRDGWFAG